MSSGERKKIDVSHWPARPLNEGEGDPCDICGKVTATILSMLGKDSGAYCRDCGYARSEDINKQCWAAEMAAGDNDGK